MKDRLPTESKVAVIEGPLQSAKPAPTDSPMLLWVLLAVRLAWVSPA